MKVYSNTEFGKHKKQAVYAIIAIAVVIVLYIVFHSVTVIGTGERGVVFNNFSGIEKRSLGEGMHFVFPLVQQITKYDVKVQSKLMTASDSISALSQDGQKIEMDLSVIYSLDYKEIWKLHQEIGSDYFDKVIKPIVRSVARNVIAGYTAEKMYSGAREKLETDISNKVKSEIKKYFINLDDVRIRNIIFSPEFSQAIEQKQVAFQESERMKYVLEKEKTEKERKIIEAEGDAEAISKKATALRQNPQLIQYEYVRKISPSVKTVVTDQNSIINFPKELFGN